MKSKTSLFNKTIFRKNMSRFWPLWTVNTIVLFFCLPFQIFINSSYYGIFDSAGLDAVYKYVQFLDTIRFWGFPLLTAGFAILAASAVFSYLFKAKDCYMMHSFPVDRRELFFTNFISAYVFLVIPQLINAALAMLICLVEDISGIDLLMKALGIQLLSCFVFLSIAVLACMIAGELISSWLYFGVLNFAYIAAKFAILWILSEYGFGLNSILNDFDPGSNDLFLSPLVHFAARVRLSYIVSDQYTSVKEIAFEGLGVLAIYCVIAVLLLALSLKLYQMRHLERSGDALVFKKLNPVVRWLVAPLGGIFCGMLFVSLFFGGNNSFGIAMVTAVICCLCAFFAVQMFLKKSFRIFTGRCILEAAACALLVIFLFAGVKLDILGLEKRIPNVDSIDKIAVSHSYTYVADTPEDIAAFVEAHKQIIREKEKNEENADGEVAYITFNYFLKNGKEMTRCYQIALSPAEEGDESGTIDAIRTMMCDVDKYLQCVLCMNYKDGTIRGGSYEHPIGSGNEYEGIEVRSEVISKETAQKLFDAYVKDLEENQVLLVPGYEDYAVNSISIDFDVKNPVFQNDYLYDHEIENGYNGIWYSNVDEQVGLYINIRKSFKNMIQVMMEEGLIASEDDIILESEYYSY